MNSTQFVEHLAALIERARIDGVPATVVCRALEEFHARVAPSIGKENGGAPAKQE